jgi:predicted Abi (CAAX) family protease
MATILQRVTISLTTIPDLGSWGMVAGILALYCAIAVPLGVWTRFLAWGPLPLPSRVALGTTLQVLLYPAIGEEILFRAIPIPHPSEGVSLTIWLAWAALSLGVFVAIHPLNALTFYPAGNPTFLQPIFLLLAALLGLACTLAHAATGSIWAAAIVHWVVVVAWLLKLGGQQRLFPTSVTRGSG